MVNKAFEVIGNRILIVDLWDPKSPRTLEGVFLESESCYFIEEGREHPALDFVSPIYNPTKELKTLANRLNPGGIVNPANPVLSLYFGVDHSKLRYICRRNSFHVFEGKLDYTFGAFITDGNRQIYEKYRAPLKTAGFRIE